MKNYRNIFFDLDRTLWDFQKNSSETLIEILEKFSLSKVIKNEQEYLEKYNFFNDNLWYNMKAGKIKKTALRHERFRLLFDFYGIDEPDLVEAVSRYYLNTAPAKTSLIPGTIGLLNYLSGKYKLYIISNGFYDVQLTKMISSGISRYFSKVFTSDIVGSAKPKPDIFYYSLSSVNAKKAESLMVGDDPINDVYGAYTAKIDQVFLNPDKLSCKITPTFEIRDLMELMKIL